MILERAGTQSRKVLRRCLYSAPKTSTAAVGSDRFYVATGRVRHVAFAQIVVIGDDLPSGSNRPQNPSATDTLNGPAKRSYIEAVQRRNQALGDCQSACAGLDPVQLARARKQPLSCH